MSKFAMNAVLSQWLEEVTNEKLVISPDDISLETRNNFWCFSFEKDISIEAITSFFTQILNHWAHQAKGKMTYYVWHDEMAGQVRCCIASVDKENLPFGCNVRLVEDLEEIIELYLSSNDFISMEELEEVDIEDPDAFDDEEINFELKVWCHELLSNLNS